MMEMENTSISLLQHKIAPWLLFSVLGEAQEAHVHRPSLGDATA